MSAVTLEQLMASPPLRTTEANLPDGRRCTISELPVAVIDRVRTSAEDEQVNMDDVVYVVAYALSGNKPTDKALEAVRESFGAGAVMAIYTEALRFSHLSPDAVEQEKKR